VIKEQIQNPAQLCFFIFIIFNFILILPFTYLSGVYTTKINRLAPNGYEMPASSDFKTCLPLAAGYTVAIQIVAAPLERIFSGCAKNADNPAEKAQRMRKSADYLAKAIYKIISVSFGYWILMETNYFPSYFGGKGDYSRIWEGTPYPKHVPYLKEYYISCTAYHVGQLFNTVIGTKSTDFAEMMLHHSVTIYLLFGSYVMNIWECGIIISFLHDFSDITAHLAKMMSHTTVTPIAVPMVITCTINWFYCRCYVFPIIVYNLFVQFHQLKLFDKEGYIANIYTYLLSCLILLHYFWWYQMVKIIINALFFKKTDDHTDRIKLDKKGDSKPKKE
jgi:hypothetical protein